MTDWISVEDEMPKHGKKVVATYKNELGNRRVIVGQHLERWKEEAGCDDEDASEYSEEKDNYFYIEGWYEQLDNWGDYSSVCVNEGEVTHWMPQPDTSMLQ